MMNKSFLFWVFLVGCLIVFDQLTKSLKGFEGVFLNYDFVFGLTLDKFWILFFSGGVLLGLFLVLLTYFSRLSVWERLAGAFVLGGGASNFFERLWFGRVKDPFNFFSGHWNLADIFIIIGVLLWLIYGLRRRQYDS